MTARLWLISAAAVLAAMLGLYLLGLGDMPLTDRDEGEYAAAVAEMSRRGDLVVPTLNGRNYLEKPILVFWLVAAGQALAGGEEGARLPSAVSAVLACLAVGLLVLRSGRALAPAVLAAGCLAFCPLLALVGRACLTDALLMLFILLSLGLFFIAGETHAPRDRLWYLLAWAALGLGFLTKGPVAPAVVVPVALIYAALERRFLATLKQAQIPWGLLIFVLINLPWYGLAFSRLGGEFWDAFFVSQNLRRFSEVLLGHGGGLFYYLPVLFLGGFPLIAAAAPELFRALVRNPRRVRLADPLARLRLFSAVAALWTLLVFSVAATKQINYILPALPFLAMLAGYFLWRRSTGEALGRGYAWTFWGLLAGGGIIWAVALAAVPLGLSVAWPAIEGSIRFDSSEYALPTGPPLMVLWPLLGALVAAAAVIAPQTFKRRGRPAAMVLAALGGGAALSAVLVLGLFPQAAEVIQAPAKRLALEVDQRVGQGGQVVTYGLWKPSLLYYLHRELPRYRVNDASALAQELAKTEPVVVMSRVRLDDKLKGLSGFQVLARDQGYLVGGNLAAAELWGRTQDQPAPEPGAPAQGRDQGGSNPPASGGAETGS